ncbi:MAG: hypothetical protein GQ534_03430, partial [Candidatus Delongbacteria bacterium]|nr:hypothetical protein [Candidatus Delongbacteria bacterium]
MVISSTQIKAFIEDSKDRALSRSFSISTNTTGKGLGDVVNIAADGLRVYSANENLMDITKGNITAYIDTSFSFNVTSTTPGKLATDVLEVGSDATKMREGVAGDRYTDFSPENMFLGLGSGENTAGENNVFIGNSSGFSNLNGGNNVYIGKESGYFSENTYQNTYVGYRSGYNMTGASNTIMGSSAGADAGGTTNNTFVGSSAGMYASGGNNTFLGNNSGYAMSVANTGTRNTYIGQSAGSSTTSGSYNVLMGFNAGEYNRSGSYNTIIGYLAGEGSYDVSYSGNVFLGSFAGINETASDRLYIANSNTPTPLIYGEFDNDLVTINGEFNVTSNATVNGLLRVNTLEIADLGSDNLGLDGDIVPYGGSITAFDLGNNTATEHWDDVVAETYITYAKVSSKNTKNIGTGLDALMKLRPVQYKTENDRLRYILVADEVEKIIPSIVISEDIDVNPETGENIVRKADSKAMNYMDLIPVLIKSIQEQQEEIESHKKDNVKLYDILEKQEDRIKKLEELTAELSEKIK